jgi:hypothetical protein
MLGFELLGEVEGVVDEGETGRFAATEVGAESEDEHGIGSDLVHGGELVAAILLGDGSESRVKNVADHLFAAKQTVRHELASANCCSRHLKREKFGQLVTILGILRINNKSFARRKHVNWKIYFEKNFVQSSFRRKSLIHMQAPTRDPHNYNIFNL